MDVKLLYVTFPDRESALSLARQLIRDGLTACMNLYRMESVYFWQGDMVEGEEFVALFKTDPSHLLELRAAIEKRHPYKVPCLLSWSAEANLSYGLWIKDCMANINGNPPADGPEATP